MWTLLLLPGDACSASPVRAAHRLGGCGPHAPRRARHHGRERASPRCCARSRELASPLPMDPRLAYWTFALLDLCGGGRLRGRRRGRGATRRRDAASPPHAHGRRAGRALRALVPREARPARPRGPRELGACSRSGCCASTSCACSRCSLAGAVAGSRALRLRHTRNATRDPQDPPAPAGLVRWHRARAGRPSAPPRSRSGSPALRARGHVPAGRLVLAARRRRARDLARRRSRRAARRSRAK